MRLSAANFFVRTFAIAGGRGEEQLLNAYFGLPFHGSIWCTVAMLRFSTEVPCGMCEPCYNLTVSVQYRSVPAICVCYYVVLVLLFSTPTPCSGLQGDFSSP